MNKHLRHPPNSEKSIREVTHLARQIYGRVSGVIAARQRLRPFICPYHKLIGNVPPGSTLLDVGCGGGLFILLLARLGRIRSGLGFDNNRAAIRVAQRAASSQSDKPSVQFEHQVGAGAEWPRGRYDVVSVIDVLHHVQPSHQKELVLAAAAHVAPDGILLYKDIPRRPRWRAWMNRLHDLVTAGEWIHYVDMEDVISWAQGEGLILELKYALNMLWYRHEWCVLRRRSLG